MPTSIEILKTDIEAQLALPEKEISIIKLVDDLIRYAYHYRASDVHINPEEQKVVVRLRVDGLLYTVFELSKNIHEEVISRIKVLSGIRTDEHQSAQDGRIKFFLKKLDGDFSFDIRVAIAPTYYGEDAILRLLVQHGEEFSIENIGFSEFNIKKVEKAIRRPYGMILATGPTGSGKTTTLYSVLKKLNVSTVSIITIEDPIEYSIVGIDQIQVNAKTGLTFADGLRAILRQDPNIVMVGEIRDQETAKIAVNAALTGHLLLSTLHTNDAATSLPRLLEMDVEPFLIASTVNIVIGQRLVRKICEFCKVEKKFSEAELTEITDKLVTKKPLSVFYEGKGCVKCGSSGYMGRIGIHEILEMSEGIREAIVKHQDASEIKKIAIKEGMVPMFDDGIEKALKGITTVAEMMRAIYD